MFRLHYLHLALTASVYASSFLFAVTPVMSKECNIPINQMDYKGPFATLFKDADKASNIDCSYPSESSPLNSPVINEGNITCLQGYLDPHQVGKKENIQVITGGTGRGKMSLNDVSTYALGGNLLTQSDDINDQLAAYKKAIEAGENFNPSYLYSLAYYDGVDTLDDFPAWAKTKKLTIDGSDGSYHVNPSIYAAIQTQTTTQDQVREIIKTASEIIKCNADSIYSDSHQCSPNYVTRKGKTERVRDLAQNIYPKLHSNDPLGSWGKLSKKEQFQALTLHINRSSPTFIVFVPFDAKCTGSWTQCALQSLVSRFTKSFDGKVDTAPAYIKAILPETTNILNGTNDEYNRFNPLQKNTNQTAASPAANLTAAATTVTDAHYPSQSVLLAAETDSSAQPPVFVPKTGDAFLDKLITRAIQVDPQCGNAPPTAVENLGATADPVKNRSIFDFLFHQSAKSVDLALTQMTLYHIYIFSPPDITEADQRLAADDNSMFRKLMPLNTSGFTTPINVPQKFLGTAQDADVSPETWTGDFTSSGEKIMEPNRIDYSVTLDKASQPGGWFSQTKKWFTFGAFRPLYSDDNIKDQNKCLLEQHLQPGAQANGFDLVTAINAGQFSQSSCPNPITTKTGSSQCVQPEDMTTKPGCQLTCNSIDGHTIPEGLKQTIESAASAFDIPPGLLLGAMYAEGGFEPRCTGGDGQYSDAEITEALSCNPDATCCNNNEGPFSLLGAYQKKSIYQAKKKAGIDVDENNPGSACNLFDSALAVANNLTSQRGYDNAFWYNTAMEVWDRLPARLTEGITRADENMNSCGGIPYSGVVTNSCSGWSDSQVVTAIRLQQGFCGNGNEWMDIHRNQILSVFHQCSQ